MSRIGKKNIAIPQGVQIQVSKDNIVLVKGPKGELTLKLDPDIQIVVENNNLLVNRPTNQIRHRALHGLYRSILFNNVNGVVNGYKRELELVGVGFKVSHSGNYLDLSLGYSHNIIFEVPKEIKVNSITEKGQNPKIVLEGIDKQLIGQVAAKIRGLRKPEPYQGKGVKYAGEKLRKKAGKTAGK
ncbi:MAG: 50S ribosomal protein L6 [Alphaproteobacteria bacterium]|nr:50S ribosomal protein L6 [Alphaproteobacteria bacterium]